jgi:polyvinyl alcohol dehydrogenase (cytochrome)
MAVAAAVLLLCSGAARAAASCPVTASSLQAHQAQWNGWGATPDNRRFQSEKNAGIPASDLPKLRLVWAFAFNGATMAYGQPAVVGGRLYVGSENGRVYSLDARTGCEHWEYKANAGVRTGMSIGPDDLLYFGDQKGSVYALDARTGALRWKVQADPHPAAMITGTPQLWRGRLYVPVASYEENFAPDPKYPCCSFRGSVLALDARTGRRIWQTYMIDQPAVRLGINKAGADAFGPSGVAVWSSPTIDARRSRLYVATGNNYSEPSTGRSDSIVALDLATGKIRWSRQFTERDAYNAGCLSFMDATRSNCPEDNGHDFDFGAPPILVKTNAGRDALIAAQKSGMVYGLDPSRNGTILWRKRVGVGGPLGGIEWGAAADSRNVYVAVSDVNWKPFDRIVDGKYVNVTDLDPDQGGGLSALDLVDGKLLWRARPARACAGREHCSPAQLSAVTLIPGAILSSSLDGHIRGYSIQTGAVLWDSDTERTFPTVNGIVGNGGSINGPGAVVAGGYVYVSSGYSRFGEAAGNVLLAFAPAQR